MKKIIGLGLLLSVLTSFKWLGDIYSISIKDIQGKKIELSDYKGKKMLFVTLPLMVQDSSIMDQLTNFQKKHADSLAVIGILSNELGFTKKRK